MASSSQSKQLLDERPSTSGASDILKPMAPAGSSRTMTSIPESFRSELYFLVAQFLDSNPDTRPVAEELKRQLTDKKLLTPRYDWTGRSHPKTFSDVQHEVGPLPSEHLLELSFRLCSVSSVRSLLGRRPPGSSTSAPKTPNVLRILSQQQFGLCPQSSRKWHEHLSCKLSFLRRTLGHLSCVYCLAFDRTGCYVFTGADDLLVKCWSVNDGRLIHTFRGASSEISDLTISHDNRLLAAGSCDKVIRVWCLQTAAPVAVLSKHTGMITAIHFCAYSANDQEFHLASTSGDGTVSFWRYHFNEHDVAEFEDTPTRYHEKIRPGQAQMLCASFSPGGIFFCVGSADHNVRVYQMNCPEGPQRILEEELHQDRVACIQWCNKPDQLQFISGSKDGTAIIWTFRSRKWQTLTLNMKTGDNQECTPLPKATIATTSRGRGNGSAENRSTVGNLQQPDNESRVTMVAWSLDDTIAITAVSDSSLKLWDARTGQLRATLKGHEDEIYVLEPHPTAWSLLLSAAHDGQIIIWDLHTGKSLFKHKNLVEAGIAPVFDAKWSPDGLAVAASDSHGHLIFIGHGSSEKFDKLPMELFFHTDYRPLLRDSFQNVVDEQTQVPPHLLPPPFLVDSEGSPYPAYIQKFVPGREKMSESEALLPGGPEPSFNIDNPQPGPSNRERGLERAAILLEQQPGRSVNAEREGHRSDTDSSGPEFRVDQIRDEDQQPGSSAVSSSNVHVNKREVVRKELSGEGVKEHLRVNKDSSAIETSTFVTESNKLFTDHDYTPRTSGLSAKERNKKVKNSGRRDRTAESAEPRPRRAYADDEGDDEDDPDDEPEQNEVENGEDSSDCSLDESDLSSMETTTDEDTSDHSYWGSDGHEEQEKNTGPPPPPKKRSPKSKKKRNAAQRCREKLLRHPGDISEEFMPSPWLSESFPKKSPYFPQIGDILMYFKQGHQKYVDLVKTRKAYQVNMKEQEWMQKKNLNDFCLVKVINLKFEIRPPRLCILKLVMLNQHTMRPTGETFSIKYHDMNDVVDFLVLYDIYKSSKGKHWKNGDRIRCQIDDCWWKGTVKKIEHHDANKRSPFLSIFCHWDNGEKEYLSPWDIEALDQDTAEVADGTPVTPEQLKSCLYQPTEEEWNSMGLETESRRISEALEAIMSLAIAEPFNYPVDLTAYPEYMLDVEYPMDLNLIKARIDNHFYRRIDAVLYDVQYITANAASFNQPKSDIVRNSKIITNLTLEIVRDSSKTQDDVSSIYHRLVESFEWSDKDEKVEVDDANSEAEEEEEEEEDSDPERSRSRSAKRKSIHKSPPNLNPKKWKHDCNELLNKMVSNPLSVPFREPVNEIDFPDYHRCITTPMDISAVREFLLVGEYSSPLDFQKDVLLIFKNSREYNTDPKAKILSMTNKLEDWFDHQIHPIIHEWRKTNRRLTLAKRKHKLKKLSKGKTIVGKGKGKGKGQSNKIKRVQKRHENSNDEEESEDDEEEVSDVEHMDGEEEEQDSSPTRPKPSRSARARRRAESSEDSGSDHEKRASGTAKAIARQKSVRAALAATKDVPEDESMPSTSRCATTVAPNIELTSPTSTSSSTPPKRISSRVPKPNTKYRSNPNVVEGYEDEDDDAPLSQRTLRKGSKQRAHHQEESESEKELVTPKQTPRAFAKSATPTFSNAENTRPRRQIKPLRSDSYKYFDEEEEDEDDEKPLARMVVKGKSNGEERQHPESSSEDDIPLARKLGQKVKQAAQLESMSLPEEGRIQRPKRTTARTVDSEEEEEDSSEDDKPLRGRKAAIASRKKQQEHLDEDSAEDTAGGNRGRKKKITRGKTGESESEFQDSEEEDSEEEEEEDSEATDESEDEDFINDSPVSKSRSSRRSQRRAQPKPNSSKRAAQALDSESEHMSTRRPSRLSNQNAIQCREEPICVRGGGRRAAVKRSYYESDNEDSARENRRPRRAAAAKKRSRLMMAETSEEEEDYDDYEERPRKRKPNPRII